MFLNSIYISIVHFLIYCIVSINAANHLPNSLINTQTEIEPIGNDTLNYRVFGKKGKDGIEKPWFDGLDMRHFQCVRRGRCERLDSNYNTCLGSKIPYESTSLALTDYRKQKELNEALNNYRVLRHVPKCWAVIQPFLCAVFKPKCEIINGEEMVYLPSLEMCRITLEPCRALYNTTNLFSNFLRCNETLFPSKCNNDVREMKFNSTGSCLKPLVPADSSGSYYPGIEGCGLQCKDPLYTDDEHRQIQKLISWGVSLCLVSNLFVVITFLVDWENANKYPALIVFYINVCFLISSVGWLVQFTPGSREDIVCRKDGTLRQSEPAAGENLSCIVVFILVYYFLTAAMVWFVFLTYAWHLRAIGNVQDRIDKKGSYFHLVAWSLPLVLTITTMALSEIDGNSIVGICFVGYFNHHIRAGILLGPLCGVIIIGGFFIIRGMVILFGLKHFANNIKSTSASNKIHLIIMRMGICAFLTLVFILVAIACHIAEFRHSKEWAISLRKFILCRITSVFDENSTCKIENRPSVAILQLHLLCLFGAGIVMSTWCWTPSSIETWKRYLKRKCGKEVVEDVKMPKHKVIAQTWAKRKEFEDKGRLSITLFNTHTDPVGLNFDVNDLNSSETHDISSTWANYLPQFVKRRMALTGAGTTNSSSQGLRRNSVDSEISFSVRHVSVESRRNSVDSQVSVKIAEMKTKVASRGRNGHHHSKQSSTSSANKRTHRRRDFISTSTGRKYRGRRESSTSIESQVIALKNSSYPNTNQNLGLFARSSKEHNSIKRRSGNAMLDPAEIEAFLANNSRLILPFLQNQDISSSSDEETSRTSLKVQDAHVNVVLKRDVKNDKVMVTGSSLKEHQEIHNPSDRNKKQIEVQHLLKNKHKSMELNCNKHLRRQTRRTQSVMTASKRNGRTNKLNKHVDNKNSFKGIEDLDLDYTRALEEVDGDSLTFTSAELDMPLGSMQYSSCSDMSTGKPQSQNSKTSCDVGIQANAYEIAKHTLGSYGENELHNAMRMLNAASRHRNHITQDYMEGDVTEMHTLLHNKNNKESSILSESEKLKMLLLPSK